MYVVIENDEYEMIKKILIPTDFSPAAWQAVQYGLNLAEMHDAEVTVLHVYPSQNKYMAWIKSSENEDPEIIKDLNLKLRNFIESLRNGHVNQINYHITSGHVTNEILTYSQDRNFDLVIMGTNSGSTHNQPGSHTAEIIRKAGFPVLVVPGLNPAVAS